MTFETYFVKTNLRKYLNALDLHCKKLPLRYQSQELIHTLNDQMLERLNGREWEYFPLDKYYEETVIDILKQANIHQVDGFFDNELDDHVIEVAIQRILSVMQSDINNTKTLIIGIIMCMWLLCNYTRVGDVEPTNRWLKILVRELNVESYKIPYKCYGDGLESIIQDLPVGKGLVITVKVLAACILISTPRAYMSQVEYLSMFRSCAAPQLLNS